MMPGIPLADSWADHTWSAALAGTRLAPQGYGMVRGVIRGQV